jgi:hypothetical protein
MAESIIELQSVNKWYGEFHVLRRTSTSTSARRAHRHLRAVGLRQVDDDPLHQPAGGAPEGPDLVDGVELTNDLKNIDARSAARSAWCSSTSTCSRI